MDLIWPRGCPPNRKWTRLLGLEVALAHSVHRTSKSQVWSLCCGGGPNLTTRVSIKGGFPPNCPGLRALNGRLNYTNPQSSICITTEGHSRNWQFWIFLLIIQNYHPKKKQFFRILSSYVFYDFISTDNLFHELIRIPCTGVKRKGQLDLCKAFVYIDRQIDKKVYKSKFVV